MNYPNFHDPRKGVPPCQTVPDPDIFMPDQETMSTADYEAAVRAAKKACGGCNYMAECFRWAFENDEPGVWGGTTQRERRLIKRRTIRSGRGALLIR